MIVRILGPLVLVSLGALLGYSLGSQFWTFAGALVGATLWGVYDAWHAGRLLRWLQHGEAGGEPRLKFVWAEILDRSRRVFKRLEQQARLSESRLDEFLLAIQASPNGVMLLDERGVIEWCNETAATHLGLHAQRDLGQIVRNMVRAPAFIAYLASGDFGHEIQIDGPGDRPSQPNRISVQIHPYGQQRMLMLTRDVTALQRAENMRRDFVANVSHEIRTPLTVLSGFVETMQNLPLEEKDRARYLNLMSQQAQRMQTLVQDLLTLSRLEGSPTPGVTDWIDGDSLVEQLVQEARGLTQILAETPHQIVVLSGVKLELAGSRSELYSAMSNLVSNAVRYTPGGGRIALGWGLKSDGSAQFSVQDTGPGIDAEHLPRLTERFYRVDRSRSRETGGTGLGLAIVKHVVQRHGGQVLINSIPGQGSTFTLHLPAHRVRCASVDGADRSERERQFA